MAKAYSQYSIWVGWITSSRVLIDLGGLVLLMHLTCVNLLGSACLFVWGALPLLSNVVSGGFHQFMDSHIQILMVLVYFQGGAMVSALRGSVVWSVGHAVSSGK